MIERMADIAEQIVIPGRFPVEAFPVLRYLPSWFPGGGFKRWAADGKRDMLRTVDALFESSESVTSNIMMRAFFLAMALYPEAQKKAQKELDAVVGVERLPDFSDRPSLPYVSALVKELLRWHPATPMGVPHRVLADDEYNGHIVPAGAIIFVNIWDILRDPELYPQPDEFIPERFLDPTGNVDVRGRDPADVAFGFGRRFCPGRHFADSTLFILCASVLSAVEIGPPVGEDGVPMPVKREASDQYIFSHPKVYNYTIKPRSAHIEQLFKAAHKQ
uniref:N/A n=1 Tax=Ganoderma boninense TaxID=34458 RepID=A0A5K1JXP8_9APHY|nr:N/A [Ganoderma boninense]